MILENQVSRFKRCYVTKSTEQNTYCEDIT